MRKIVFLLLLLAPIAAQATSAARFDLPVLTTTPAQVPIGSLPELLAVTNATIAICGYPATLSGGMCTNTITTYTDSTLATACPSTAQLTSPGTAVCISTTGLQGSFGFWYDSDAQTHLVYTVRSKWGTFGPFDILQGGGGGTGCTSSGAAGTLQAANGSGGCEAVLADYGITEANSFTFRPVGDFAVTNTATGDATFSLSGGAFTVATGNGMTFADSSTTGISLSSQGDLDLAGANFNASFGAAVDISSVGTYEISTSNDYSLFAQTASIYADLYLPDIAAGSCAKGLAQDSSGKTITVGCSSGGITGLTTGYIPLAGSATTLTGNSHIDDGMTAANTLTMTEGIAINDGTGHGGSFAPKEGTAISAATGYDILYADSTNHCLEYSPNGGAFSCLGTGAGTIISSPQFQIPYFSASGTARTLTGDPDASTDGAGNFILKTINGASLSYTSADASAFGGGAVPASTVGGGSNTGFGVNLFGSSLTGSFNNAFGTAILTNVTSGTQNTGTGSDIMSGVLTGIDNNAYGHQTLLELTSGDANNAFGSNSLQNTTTGGYNSALGDSAIQYITTGSQNVAVGYHAGTFIPGSADNLTPANSVYLGVATQPLNNNDTNEIVVGYNAVGAGSNTATYGNSSISETYINGMVNMSAASIAPTSTTVVPLTVNTPSGSTADLQDWGAAGSAKTAFINQFGGLNIAEVESPTALTLSGNLGKITVTAGPNSKTFDFNVLSGWTGTATAGTVVTGGSTTHSVVACAISCTNAFAVVDSNPNSNAYIQSIGSHSVNLDGTYTVTGWEYACASPTTAGTVMPSATLCPTGEQIGYVTTPATSVTTATIFLQFK